MKLLHLTTDNRFVNSIPSAFESVAKGKNTYWVVHDGKPEIVKIPIGKLLSTVDVENPDIAIELNDYDIVFLHSFAPEFYPLIENADQNIKFVWLGWGFDYYDLLPWRLTLPKTTSITGGAWRYKLRELKKRFITKTLHKKINLFSKIKYFCPVLPQEYEMLVDIYPSLPPYFEWNYGAINPDLIPPDQMDMRIDGNNILMGNSATPSNNHIESLDILSDLDWEDRDVIVPLSYGDKRYKNKILPLLDEEMNPIVDFLQRDNYIEIMRSCSIALMNHTRQQAFGSIVIMLHMGAKIYLREENPLYHRLKEWGVTVFSIEKLEHDRSDFFIPISSAQADKNRQAVANYYSLNNYCKRTKALIEKVAS